MVVFRAIPHSLAMSFLKKVNREPFSFLGFVQEDISL
jgi:hypothetical protein